LYICFYWTAATLGAKYKQVLVNFWNF
jgi:hypothetical protein